MSIQLYRVDERLIHGQVVIGWGSQIHPRRYLVVDDTLAASQWEQELYLLGVPEGASAEFWSVDEARARLEGWRQDAVPSVLLTRDIDSMLRLAARGLLKGDRVNLGGIRHGPGRVKVLSFLYLDEEDRGRLRSLADEGVDVSARDLPGSPRVDLEGLLR